MFACEMPPFRSVRVPFAPLSPNGAASGEARRGWLRLQLQMTDGWMPARRCVRVGDVKCAMTITNDR